MALFSKKPNQEDTFKINQAMKELNYHNETIVRMDNVEGFLNEIHSLKETVEKLLKYERKYPKVFNPKPSVILKNFELNKILLEKNFIDRYVEVIERKLLDYSTDRGKKNNLFKKVDLLRYYVDEFDPETLVYFNCRLSERFPQYFK